MPSFHEGHHDVDEHFDDGLMLGVVKFAGNGLQLQKRHFHRRHDRPHGKEQKNQPVIIDRSVRYAGGIQANDRHQKSGDDGVRPEQQHVEHGLVAAELPGKLLPVRLKQLAELEGEAVGKRGYNLLEIGEEQGIDSVHTGIVHAAHKGNDDGIRIGEDAVGNLVHQHGLFL